MGKNKRRNLSSSRTGLKISREDAIVAAAQLLEDNPSSFDAKDLISLFGLKAEELAEAGVSYETLRSFDGMID